MFILLFSPFIFKSKFFSVPSNASLILIDISVSNRLAVTDWVSRIRLRSGRARTVLVQTQMDSFNARLSVFAPKRLMPVRTLEIQSPELESGPGESQPQPRVKYRDKGRWHKTGSPKPNAAAHHESHDGVRFQIKEVPEGPGGFRIRSDAHGMLQTHPIEHGAENGENDQR